VTDLKLERRNQHDTGIVSSNVAITPHLGEDYWAYRVLLGERQAIIGFPKFFTIGIGFAVEENWNANLPYTCDADDIFLHIRCNKGDDSIPDADVVTAIRMVQDAIREDQAVAP
jgi:hypothetical protein